MIPARKHADTTRGILGVLACVVTVLILLHSQGAAQGVRDGLFLCYNSLIPALFPFLILTRLLLETGVCKILGFLLLPYCRLLRIRDTRVASALAIGLLGGFATAGCSIDLLFRRGRMTNRQAGILLCACAVEGPAFVIFAVGGSMLGSLRLGVLLWLSLVLSSLLSAALLSRFSANEPSDIPDAENSLPPSSCATLLVGAVSGAVDAMLRICGFVLLFSLLQGIFLSLALPEKISAFFLSLLEVTNGCRAACALGGETALFFCILALGSLGLCGLAQLRALLSPAISLSPFLFSRLLQLPLCAALFFLLRRFFAAGISSAALPQSEKLLVFPFHMPREAALFLFLFLAVFCSELVSKRSLRRSAKGL